MTPAHDIDLSAVLAERLTTAHPDVLRELLATFIPDFTGAEADAVCGAGSNERSTDRSQAPWVNTCQSPYRAPELMGFSSGDGWSAVLLAAFALLGSGFTAVRSPFRTARVGVHRGEITVWTQRAYFGKLTAVQQAV